MPGERKTRQTCEHCNDAEAVRDCCVSFACRVCDFCWNNSEGNFVSCPTYRRDTETSE